MKESTSIHFMPDRYMRTFIGKTGEMFEDVLIGMIDVDPNYIVEIGGYAEKNGVNYSLYGNPMVSAHAKKICENLTGIYICSNTIEDDGHFEVTVIVRYKK